LHGKWSRVFSISLFYAIIVYLVNKGCEAIIDVSAIPTLGNFMNLIGVILLMPLTFGVTASVIKLMRNENVALSDFINIGLKNFGKVWGVFLNIFLKIIIKFIIATIILIILMFVLASSIGNTGETFFVIMIPVITLIYAIFTIIVIAPYVLSMPILYDNPAKPSTDIVDTSAGLMKGNISKFYLLILSFIGWFLLFGVVIVISNLLFTPGISVMFSHAGTVLLTPYVTATQIAFYEKLKDKFNKPENV